MEALVECLKGTKEKYEKDEEKLVLNRYLKRKWITNYGCILNTLQADGDELDCYIIGKNLHRGQIVDTLPLCIIYCIDNGQVDNKVICAAPTAGKHNFHTIVNRIFKFIEKYKKNSFPVFVSWRPQNITYELAKCKAYYNLFKGGES